MKKELDYYMIDDSYGSCQDWFSDFWMKIGGCAAIAACDSCIFFAKTMKMTHLYPYDPKNITREEFIRFGMEMKPYLRPRIGGIDKLEIYMEGFGKYLREHGEIHLTMESFSGENSKEEARKRVMEQIDKGWLIPCLTLKHRNPAMKHYTWHWYLLTGYGLYDDRLMVKAVTYSHWRWVEFDKLWDTGYEQKGGLILYHKPGENG
jgi:hypothetical protein